MDTRLFVSMVREWADDMEEQEFPHAYQRAMDLYVLGQPLAEEISLASASSAVTKWNGKPPSELLDGLAGFLVCVAVLCERDAAAERARQASRNKRSPRKDA